MGCRLQQNLIQIQYLKMHRMDIKCKKYELCIQSEYNKKVKNNFVWLGNCL